MRDVSKYKDDRIGLNNTPTHPFLRRRLTLIVERVSQSKYEWPTLYTFNLECRVHVYSKCNFKSVYMYVWGGGTEINTSESVISYMYQCKILTIYMLYSTPSFNPHSLEVYYVNLVCARPFLHLGMIMITHLHPSIRYRYMHQWIYIYALYLLYLIQSSLHTSI